MNDDNIGWYWKMVGIAMLAGAICIPVYKVVHDKEFSVADVALSLGFLVSSLVIVRPSWMDKHFKDLLDAIPSRFVKYSKDSDNK